MDLPQRDIVISDVVPRQHARNRVRGCHEQSLGKHVYRRDLPIDKARARDGAGQALDSRAGGHPQARCAIGEGRCVPCGDRALAARSIEGRLQLRQALEAGVRARKAIARHAFDRNDQIVEESGFLTCDRLLVAGKRKLVLRIARDVPGLGHFLAVLAHALAGGAIGHGKNVQADVAHPQFPEQAKALRYRARLRKAPQPVGKILREPDLHAAHALHAADEGELLAAVPEHPCRLESRDHARRAGEHSGKRRDGLIQARLDLHLARDVRIAEVRNHRPPDDQVRLHRGPRPGHRPHDRQRELHCIEPGERAVHARERRAQAGGEPEFVSVHGTHCKAGPVLTTHVNAGGNSRPERRSILPA